MGFSNLICLLKQTVRMYVMKSDWLKLWTLLLVQDFLKLQSHLSRQLARVSVYRLVWKSSTLAFKQMKVYNIIYVRAYLKFLFLFKANII